MFPEGAGAGSTLGSRNNTGAGISGATLSTPSPAVVNVHSTTVEDPLMFPPKTDIFADSKPASPGVEELSAAAKFPPIALSMDWTISGRAPPPPVI
jgi:hypothetical protein